MKTLTVSLPPQLVAELDRVREREHRSRAEILREALRRYISMAERGRTIPVEDARGECVRLEDLRRELGVRSR
jgi:metal-responsive CopG/Arc/MetJ family transcriptional regulator